MNRSFIWHEVEPLKRHVNRIQAIGEIFNAESEVPDQ
jgi:hypothetical protein